MSFLFPFLKNSTIFASFHVFGMRRSVMHFVYSFASCFTIVSSPAFSVSMLTLSFPASVPFFIFLSHFTSHAIIGGASLGSVCIVTAWSLSYNSEYNSSIRSMILSCSWICLPCLSSSVIIRFFPRLGVLLTFFKLLDASIVSRISSKLCFRISSFAFFFYGLTYLHIFYVVSGALVLYRFSTLLVGDDIFGFFCFLVCFAMLNALCWIISVMFLFRLSMSSCSSSAVNLLFSSS